jgi:hypothetical protein
MGEVYRARDPRLGREVAIKVLREDRASDRQGQQRFGQEAKAAGALNHPNVLVVFDTGEHEGAPFVVFELLEGETLRTRLASGAIPSPRALDYAIQIARGLAAAHEKGIVHRDLKPENLFVTRDGRVKILDFGLAKLRPPLGTTLDTATVGAAIPTASGLTEAGAVLGTVGYMSPEQIRLSPADHRSDIFSFGSVLYEMLAGRRAFQGETPAETMTAILKAEPPALLEANGGVPLAFERIVRHCLEKQPQDRFQSARDLVFDLESLAAVLNTAVLEGTPTPRRRRRLLPAMTGAVGLVAGVGGALLWWPQPLASPQFQQVTFRRQLIAEARFAPDGQTIIYGAAAEGRHTRLFSARLGSAEVRALDLPQGDIAGITASGEMAVILQDNYYSREPGTLARVSLAGGAPRELLEHVAMADWGPDGTSLAVIRHNTPKPRLEFPIGKVLYDTPTSICCPRVSPKGDRVAFKEDAPEGVLVRVVDLAGRVTTLATSDIPLGVAWSPRGDEVWFSAWGILRAVTLDGRQRVLTHFPGPITINDVAPDGRILVTTAQWYRGLMFAGPSDTKERDLGWFEFAGLGALSRDGALLLFSDRGRASGPPVPAHSYLRRTEGSPAVRLADDPAAEARPLARGGAHAVALSLSPDGKWASALLHGRPMRCVLLPAGPGETRPLPLGDLECQGASWFPDGKRMAVAGNAPGHATRMFVHDLESGARRPLTPEGFGFAGDPSPDGKLVPATDASGQLVLFPVEGGQPQEVPGLRPGEASAGWGADSRSLYVYPKDGELPVEVDKLDLRTGRRELFKALTPPEVAASSGIEIVRVTPSGKAYAYVYGHFPCILYVIEGVQ